MTGVTWVTGVRTVLLLLRLRRRRLGLVVGLLVLRVGRTRKGTRRRRLRRPRAEARDRARLLTTPGTLGVAVGLAAGSLAVWLGCVKAAVRHRAIVTHGRNARTDVPSTDRERYDVRRAGVPEPLAGGCAMRQRPPQPGAAAVDA